MPESLASPELSALAVAVFFLILGFVAVWVCKRFLGLEKSDLVLVALLLVPALMYLIASGRLSEFQAPGGWEAKFAAVASKPVEKAFEPAPDRNELDAAAEEAAVMTKGAVSDLPDRLARIDRSKPIILTLTLGAGVYIQGAVAEYVDDLRALETFRFLALQHADGRLAGYVPAKAAVQIMTDERLAGLFIDAVNEGDRDALAAVPGVVTEVLPPDATLVDALEEMTERHLGALLVAGKTGGIGGVVDRDQVLGKILVGLAK